MRPVKPKRNGSKKKPWNWRNEPAERKKRPPKGSNVAKRRSKPLPEKKLPRNKN